RVRRDVRRPIGVAPPSPHRLPYAGPPATLQDLTGLEFHELDESRFPSVRLAREAAGKGGGHPAVLNAANEEAVNAFVARDIPFSGIIRVVERALSAFPGCGGIPAGAR